MWHNLNISSFCQGLYIFKYSSNQYDLLCLSFDRGLWWYCFVFISGTLFPIKYLWIHISLWTLFNTLRPRHHFADNIFKCIFLNENAWIALKISLKFVPKVQLTIFQDWFRWWLGAGQATSHYLNQWWLVYWRIYASLSLNELTVWSMWLIYVSNGSGKTCSLLNTK